MNRATSEYIEWFDSLSEQEKLEEIWKIAHFETLNSVNKHELHYVFRWLTELTLEEEFVK